MTTAIARVEAARRELQSATTPLEAQVVRAKAMGLEHYAQVAKDRSLEVEAAEIRLRAERRLGELLVETPKNPGGRPGKVLSNAPLIHTLEQLGISKDHSSLCQCVARVPLGRFESFLKERRLLERPARAKALFAPWGVSSEFGPSNGSALRTKDRRWRLTLLSLDGSTLHLETRGDEDLRQLAIGATISTIDLIEVIQ